MRTHPKLDRSPYRAVPSSQEDAVPDDPNPAPERTEPTDDEVRAEDVLVEDVSIDGMCGVY